MAKIKNKIKTDFETFAFDYDGLIPKLIPHYREQNQLMVDLIPRDRATSLRVLDLGTGTGILSYFIVKNFKNAEILALDLAKNMLEVAQKNLAEYSDRITFQQGDFAECALGMSYDIIISGLAIHHLENPQKQKLFASIFQVLKPGGIFLNRDIVLGATPALTQQYEQLWRDYISSNGEDSDRWFNNYLEQDIPASVEEQIQWLKEVGFVDVSCHWRYLNFAIFGGCKPNSTIKEPLSCF
ncbi:MAG: class I SAM-dependent methyltransferase [Cyanobacteria bacterium SBLK]|nr:class I SAM-dependent methyltransferase [Cyanobacteria bacterium SBLK]